MEEIEQLRRDLHNAQARIANLEDRLNNLSNQLLHVFQINNLNNPYT